MKNSPLNTFLTYALGTSLLFSLYFCFKATKQTSEFRQLETGWGQINQSRAQFQVLMNACTAYARTNAALDPILESVGLDPKAGRTAAKTATK